MSHDQKPSKVRLVSSGAIDGAQGAPAGGSAGDAARARASDTPAAPARATRTGLSPIVLALLFILGCAIGGAALPLLHIL